MAAFALAIAVAGFAFFARTFAGRERPEANVPPAVTNGVIAYRNIGGSEGVFRTIRPDGTDPREVHVGVPGFVGVPSWSPDGTRIVFDVNSFPDPHPESEHFDIYAANADGTDPTRLTFDQNDHSPVWSPDGNKIAYVLGIGNVQQIVVMNADGSDPRQLTDTEGLNILPSWSPDSTRIAFVSWDGSNSDIYVMDADGSNVQRITDDPSHEDQPAWSPDGRLIAFSRVAVSSEDSKDDGIFTMAPDGTGITKLFHVPDAANVSFAWSPDGGEMAINSITSHRGRTMGVLDLATGILTPITEPGAWDGATWQPIPATAEPLAHGSIVFTREQPGRGCDLFTIEPDGTGQRALTTTPSTCEVLPSLAPGAAMVAVSLDLDDIAVIDVATSSLRRLTDDPTTLDNGPAWSPDGSQIAFSRGTQLGPSYLYVMEADGSSVRRLTQGNVYGRHPAWSPDGTKIAFARSGNYGYEVYVMDADGSNVTEVTSVRAESAPYPAWSPDGSQIALDVDGAIYVTSVDGTGLHRLSPQLPNGVLDMQPTWSPDGTQIVFTRYTNEDVAHSAEDGDIWIIGIDGTRAQRVTQGLAIDSSPQWVP